MKACGARTFVLPPDFTSVPAEGWQASLSPSTDGLRILFPSGIQFYEGTMPTTPDWPHDVAKSGSTVLITGPMATLSDLEPLISRGRVLWLRIPVQITE